MAGPADKLTEGKMHGYVQLFVAAVVIILLILVIALIVMVGKKTAERFSAKRRMVTALQRSASTTPFASEVGRERLTIEQSDRARLVKSLQGGLSGTEHLTDTQKRALLAKLQGGLSGTEHLTDTQKRALLTKLQGGLSGAEHLTPQERSNKAALVAKLQGRLGSEGFINHMPMLGGGTLTPGAIALRAADPIASEPISPSQKQYMKENELLEHLLYK